MNYTKNCEIYPIYHAKRTLKTYKVNEKMEILIVSRVCPRASIVAIVAEDIRRCLFDLSTASEAHNRHERHK